jgi:hypothetical protein
MFFNSFVRNDRMPFYYWIATPPRSDPSGNALIVDYRLNLLVMFLTGESRTDPADFWFHRETREGAVFHTDRSGKEVHFVVPRKQDVVIVFRADGSCEELPLAAGQARMIYDLLADGPNDFAVAFPRIYVEQHPNETH